MTSDTERTQIEYFEILNSQNFIPEDLDYTILDKHTKFLDKLNVIENSSISIFDLYQKNMFICHQGLKLFLVLT